MTQKQSVKNDKNGKKNILFVFKNISAFLELFALAGALEKTNKYQATFYLHRAKGKIEDIVAMCRKNNMPLILGEHAQHYLAGNLSLLKPRKVEQPILRFFYNLYWRTKEKLIDKIKNIWLARKIFKEHKIDFVIFDSAAFTNNQEISTVSLHGYLFKRANKSNIPSAVYTWFAIQPHNPIKQMVGDMKFILVSSDFQKEIIMDAGIDQKRIFVVGRASDDSFFNNNIDLVKAKQDLISKYGLDSSKRIALVAISPYLEEKMLNKEENLKAITILLSSVCEHYNQLNVLVSLHPRMVKTNYLFLRMWFPVYLIDERCCEVLPLCDFFFAGITSLVRNSLMLNVPIAVFNPIPIPHAYTKERGFIEAEDEAGFRELVNKIVLDNDFYRSIKKKLLSNNNFFGFNDGKSSERAIEVIDNILNKQ